MLLNELGITSGGSSNFELGSVNVGTCVAVKLGGSQWLVFIECSVNHGGKWCDALFVDLRSESGGFKLRCVWL